MSILIDTLDYPFQRFRMCPLWASQHLPALLRVTVIVIIIAAGYYLTLWLQHCSDRIKQLSRELARPKARGLQQDEVIKHLAAQNTKMRSERPNIEAYMPESAHSLLVILLRGCSDISPEERLVPAGITRNGDLLLPKDPEDRKCIVCLAEFTCNEELVVLPCGHIFHPRCNERWMKRSFSCAHCQRKLRWVMALAAPNRVEMNWKYAKNVVTEIGRLGGV